VRDGAITRAARATRAREVLRALDHREAGLLAARVRRRGNSPAARRSYVAGARPRLARPLREAEWWTQSKQP
jgi:hypothetical protein